MLINGLIKGCYDLLSMSWRVWVAVVVGVLLVVAALYAVFNYYAPTGEKTLVIYTYSSLFTYAPNVTAVNDTVFGEFEAMYHVHIDVVRFSGTQSMLQALIQQKSNPQADLVIGLTNIEAPEAISQGILQNYTPPNLKYVPSFLVDDLDPNHYLVPYEYAPITVDYCNTTMPANVSFDYLAQPSVASHLVLENPTIDSTGLSFLLYEIAFYTYVEHSNWLTWWQQVSKYANIQPTWDAAFNIFPSKQYNMAVSYGSDPAYFAYYNMTGCGTAAMHYQGKTYTWLEIEGMGIVKGAHHPALAEAFENWFLSTTVQSLIPTSEWVFPANSQVTLPSLYSSAVNYQGSVVLNNYLSPQEISANLSTWLSEWQSAVEG